MTRKLKFLGVALIAVLALTAVVASAASASGSYTASSYPTTGTAESAVGNDTFTMEAGKVECKAHFVGTLTGKSSSLTVTPTYTNCKAFGFSLGVELTMGSCDYHFGTPTGSGDSWSAPMEVGCTSAEPIVLIAGTCEVQLGAQSPTGSVAITNETAGKDVKIKANVTGIRYTVTKDGIGCPFNTTKLPEAKTGGTYIQDAAVTFASTNGATIDVGL